MAGSRVAGEAGVGYTLRVKLILIPLLLGVLSMASFESLDPSFDDLLPNDAEAKKLASGMKFIEGPAWVQDADSGYLLFTDIPANKIMKWSERDGLVVWREPSENANGLTLDNAGRVIACEHGSRVVSITENNQRRVLLEHYQEKRFNSPNDVVVKKDGTVWFTDPPYGLNKRTKELEGDYVFRFDPKTNALTIVSTDQDKPNGLCFSPDEKRLYIADSGKPHNIRVYDVKDDGTLANGREFAAIDKGVPDGMRCDEKGNLWSSSKDGAQIFKPDGKRMGRVLIPETVTNLTFGGKDGKTLFLTGTTSLYSIQTNVRGAR